MHVVICLCGVCGMCVRVWFVSVLVHKCVLMCTGVCYVLSVRCGCLCLCIGVH